ncbi:hypothetical protein DES53_10891 [Roseimicrobium gellanilyticum]|uniref:Uncharacterized protein n=1 Tax=Roseimicrobium gellanilyticum TaxID=748857 RepID=A0A366HFA1_9BACT|nr:hypothetical protein [Roseimicrobium gellanilyticum]RBP40384.1 hypothetical protein DES53_10891 [Roseimicrobium gellanilyticum]
MGRRILSYLANVLICAAIVLPIAYVSLFRMVTGQWFPKRQVETLSHPVAVHGWTTEGLQLTDGRLLRLAGVTALPKESMALSEATKRGVEVSQDGRVFALVRVHHWCGNDPVREHIARVDLADMLVFLGEASPVKPLSEWQKELLAAGPSSRFGEHGWNVSHYGIFQGWRFEGRQEDE